MALNQSSSTIIIVSLTGKVIITDMDKFITHTLVKTK